MSTPNSSLFAAAIEEHLELKRRNRHLDDELPLDSFVDRDPFENHPLFKSEAEARREEEETGEHPAIALEASEDTAAMPAVDPVEPDAGRGWMETSTAGDFSWD
jgi:hypothetical protein